MMKEISCTNFINNMEGSIDSYDNLVYELQKNAEKIFENSDPKEMFYTDAKDIYNTFLENLPENERAEHMCHTCKDFINKFTNVIKLDKEGNITPVYFHLNSNIGSFNKAINACYDKVKNSKITSIFLLPNRYRSSDNTRCLGHPESGGFSHMFMKVPSKSDYYNNRCYRYNEVIAKSKENYRLLAESISKFSLDAVKTITTMLKFGNLPDINGIARDSEYYENFRTELEKKKGKERNNYIWWYVSHGTERLFHLNSGLLGTLYEDMMDGLDADTIRDRYIEKADPMNYMRMKSKPSYQNTVRAEELINKLGLLDSLDRRYATFDEVPKIWVPKETKNESTKGLFTHLAKEEETKTKQVSSDHAIPISFNKFLIEVLPNADKIRCRVDYTDAFMCICTAKNDGSKPLFKYGHTFSQYTYNGGATSTQFGLFPNRYIEVTGICKSPEYFNVDGKCKSYILLLKDCRDSNYENIGSAIFPELLIKELHEIRSTIEAYSNNSHLSNYENATANGINIFEGYNGMPRRFLKVESNGVELTYNIKLFD